MINRHAIRRLRVQSGAADAVESAAHLVSVAVVLLRTGIHCHDVSEAFPENPDTDAGRSGAQAAWLVRNSYVE
jgi:hypothetical protein